jgi:hypothetical protein
MGLFTGAGETLVTFLPPMASYRWTMSEIDVRRVARGFGSMGDVRRPGEVTVEDSISGLLDGNMNKDCGRDRAGSASWGELPAEFWGEIAAGLWCKGRLRCVGDRRDSGDSDLGLWEEVVIPGKRCANELPAPAGLGVGVIVALVTGKSISLSLVGETRPPPQRSTRSCTELCRPFLLGFLDCVAWLRAYPPASSGPSSALDAESAVGALGCSVFPALENLSLSGEVGSNGGNARVN